VPTRIRESIEATTDVRQLDIWLERFATAVALDEIGIEL
jgi:hypothetical protein